MSEPWDLIAIRVWGCVGCTCLHSLCDLTPLTFILDTSNLMLLASCCACCMSLPTSANRRLELTTPHPRPKTKSTNTMRAVWRGRVPFFLSLHHKRWVRLAACMCMTTTNLRAIRSSPTTISRQHFTPIRQMVGLRKVGQGSPRWC